MAPEYLSWSASPSMRGLVATVPDLPGCMSDGATPEEALTNVQDAISTWIEAANGLGHSVPKPSRKLALTSS